MINLAVLACVFRTTTKKGQLFHEKSVSPEKILATSVCVHDNSKSYRIIDIVSAITQNTQNIKSN